jgi:hypothetical protein
LAGRSRIERLVWALSCRYSGDHRMENIAPLQTLVSVGRNASSMPHVSHPKATD